MLLANLIPVQADSSFQLSILLEGSAELGFFAISTDPVENETHTEELSNLAIERYEEILEQGIFTRALENREMFSYQLEEEPPAGFSETVYTAGDTTIYYAKASDHQALFQLEEGTWLICAINSNPSQFVYPFFVELEHDLEVFPKQIEHVQLELDKVDENLNPISQLCIFESFADENCSAEYLIQSESSDVDGKMFFDLYDHFYLRESYAPDGYVKNEKVTAIDYDGLQLTVNNENVSPFKPLFFINEKKVESPTGEIQPPVNQDPVIAGNQPTGTDSHHSLMAAFFIGALGVLSLIIYGFKRKGERE